MWGVHNISTSMKSDSVTFKYFPALTINVSYYKISPTHLASKPDKTNPQRHREALLDPIVLHALNLKRRQNAAAKSADKVFIGWSFQWCLDKSIWHSQDYSVCREDWNNVSSGYTVCPNWSSLFQRLPLQCVLHVSKWDKMANVLHGKLHPDIKHRVMQSQALSTDLMKSPFSVQVFPLRSSRTRVKKKH